MMIREFGLASKAVRRITAVLISAITMFSALSVAAFASEKKTSVPAKIYELKDGSKYIIGDSVPSSADAVGQLFIEGTSLNEDVNNIPVYKVGSSKASFTYEINAEIKERDPDEWHLTDDKSRRVNEFALEKNIMSGALILQTSLDGENWVDELKLSDVFDDASKLSAFYNANEVQLQNGCYFRIFIAYRMERQLDDSKFLFFTKHNYEYKQIVEEYAFYLYRETDEISPDASPQKRLGSKINTGKDNGYSGNEPIDKDDPHYGWDIGYFYINGYTREANSQNDTPIFLKNVGDRVTLWFHLSEDITKLRGNEKLTVSEDTNGYDREFEIAQTDFEHGTLIIRHTNEKGKAEAPVIYTDYLAANARTGADVKVQLFEEGDYDVSLNYELKSMGGAFDAIASYSNYKIRFSFSIRNGNCMVYPFDISTGAELHDNTITENGFKLDMANSKYLNIDVRYSVLTVGTDGYLTEDVRYNRPAKDGDTYSSEGIYTFRVSNRYTKDSTEKTIYVGKDGYLRALSATGMSISELNEKIKEGAIVHNDGTIEVVFVSTEQFQTEKYPDNFGNTVQSETSPRDEETKNSAGPDENNNPFGGKLDTALHPVIVVGVGIAAGIGAVIAFKNKKQRDLLLKKKEGDEK